MKTPLLRGVTFSLFALASAARADDLVDGEPRRPLTLRPLEDLPEQRAKGARVTNEERPFLYTLDPTTPSRGAFSAEYTAGLASGVAADRPLPQTVGAEGLVHAFTLGAGVTDRIAPFVTGRVLQPVDEGQSSRGGGAAGVRLQLTPPSSTFRLAVALAGQREFGGTFGAWGRVAASLDVDRVRIAANAHGEKAFAKGRDELDVMAIAGVSYRALDGVRFGVEYVGQELEAAVEKDEAEGGVRHFAGPTLALDLDKGRFQLVAGPAFGLNQQSPNLLGRVSALMSF